MTTNVKYSDLHNDLLKLYCSTNNPSLENVFIRFAEGYTNNISAWLKKNQSHKDKLTNPLVYDALITLDSLIHRIDGPSTMSEILKVISSNPRYLKTLPIIISFQNLLTSSARDILSPYKGIINTIAAQMSVPENQAIENTSEILSDLMLLQDSFIQDKSAYSAPVVDKNIVKRQTLPKQRQQIFTYLLKRFSDELASASEAAGLTEIAQRFRDGILAVPPPVGIGEYIELDPITDDQMTESKRMADYIFQYPGPEYSNYLHDLVEIQLLQHSGGITPEDAFKFKETYERQRNVLNYIDQDQPEYVTEQPGIDTGDQITGDACLNPDFIYMLSMFFFFMQRRLKMPPSGMMMI